MATVGGVKEVEGNQNSLEIENLARFAVDEHNKKEVSFSHKKIQLSFYRFLCTWMMVLFCGWVFASRNMNGFRSNF